MLTKSSFLAILFGLTASATLAQGTTPASSATSPAPVAPSVSVNPRPVTPVAAPVTTAPAAAPVTTAPTAVIATTGPAAAPATPTPAATPSTSTEKIIYCPPIEKLMKKELFWGAPGGWRSYSQSFVNNIETFVGAQWVGIEVGKMLCVYKGKESFDFPVVLQNDTLTPAPKGDKWISQKGGYVNCLSSQTEKCPFQVEEQKKDMSQIYEDLNFKKNQPDTDAN